jgi:hypothetical protein
VFLDTFAMLNTNLTSSATVNLVGSNDSTFATVGVIYPLTIVPSDPNVYYINPTLPSTGYRYWRIQISDPTNQDGYISVGTIVFGNSEILQGECFVDEISFERRVYADVIQTEGFTNVSNFRAQKKIIGLDFRSLDLSKSNYVKLRDIFTTARTISKCLWIPTPDVNDAEQTARYALFAKLTGVPVERHNTIGTDTAYVSFGLSIDESL